MAQRFEYQGRPGRVVFGAGRRAEPAAEGVDHVAELVAAEPYANPRPVTRKAVRAILEAARAGEPAPVRATA